MRITLWGLPLLASLLCCSTPPTSADEVPATPEVALDPPKGALPDAAHPASAPASEPSSAPGVNRAALGTARLEATPAGRVVLRGIKAHGGLDAWYAGKALRFRYAYRPVDGRGAKNSLQTIDLFESRAYHDMDEPAKGVFAWDGSRAWSKFDTPDAKVPVHFWALTPYYFVGLPFVFADPGVHLDVLLGEPDFGLPPCDVVRVTFAADTGDAPGDYYLAHFAKRDGRLLAVRYVVSWKPFVAPRGLAHTPEKLLVYSEFDGVGALTMARTHTFYAIADGARGPAVTVATVSDLAHPAVFDPARLVPPPDAVFDDSLANAH